MEVIAADHSVRDPSSVLRPPVRRRLPVIAMTAGAMQEDRERCFEAGMDDYVSKPVNPVEMVRVLDRWLGKESSQESEVRSQEREDVRKGDVVRPEQEAKGEKQTQAENAASVFNRAALLDRCMDDEQLARKVLEMTLENVPKQIRGLQASLEADDAPAARLEAHTIKGMAGNVGAMVLRALAGEMEAAAHAGNLDDVRIRMEDVKAQFERVMEAANFFLESI